MRLVRNCLGLWLLSALALSCGDSDTPANVAGSYTLSITNGINGCMFANFMDGAVTTNVPFDVVQDQNDKSKASGTVGGAVGVVAMFLFGTNTFQGTVSGNKISLAIIGSREDTDPTNAACKFRINSYVEATLGGDTLTGTIAYRYNVTDAAACGTKSTCATTQSFNGTRPVGSTAKALTSGP